MAEVSSFSGNLPSRETDTCLAACSMMVALCLTLVKDIWEIYRAHLANGLAEGIEALHSHKSHSEFQTACRWVSSSLQIVP